MATWDITKPKFEQNEEGGKSRNQTQESYLTL